MPSAILAGRRALLATPLCLLLLAACLVTAAWPPPSAARAESAVGCAAPDLNAARSVTVGLRPSDTASGDFNADGRRDVVVANGGSTFVSLLLGSASGLFTATSVETGGATQVAAADFNDDGKDDIVVGRTQSIAVRLTARAASARSSRPPSAPTRRPRWWSPISTTTASVMSSSAARPTALRR